MQSAQWLIPNPAFDVPGGRIEKKGLVDAKIQPHAIGNTYYEIRNRKYSGRIDTSLLLGDARLTG